MSGACAVALDSHNTSVTFAVRWWGAITVRGRFAQVTGDVVIPNGDLSAASARLSIDATSVRTGIGLRDRHLRGPEFLDAGRYPSITFWSTRVEPVKGALTISGRMALRGIEREIVVRCPLRQVNGGSDQVVTMEGRLLVSRTPHGVASARGLHILNPLLHAIGEEVAVTVRVLIPANRLLPALLPALGR